MLGTSRTQTPRIHSKTTPGDYHIALALWLSICGYEVIAPLNAALGLGVGASIIFRLILLAIILLIVVRSKLRIVNLGSALLPMLIFLILFLMRFLQNKYIDGYVWYSGTDAQLLIFIFSIILPAVFMPHLLRNGLPESFIPAGRQLTRVFILGILAAAVTGRLNIADIGSGERFSVDGLNAISLGGTAGMLILMLVTGGFRCNSIQKFERFAQIILLSIILLLTQSRGAWLGTVGGLFVILLYSNARNRIWLFILTFFIGATSIYLVPLMSPDLTQKISEAFIAPFNFDINNAHDTTGLRILQYRDGFQIFLESPLFGRRVFSTVLYLYPHNIFIQSLMSVGLLGTLFLLIHLGLAAHAAASLPSTNRLSSVRLMGALFAISFLQAQFSGGVETESALWVTSATLISLRARRSKLS